MKGDFNLFYDLIILGGGSSGMLAAIKANSLGINVAIVEGTDRVGKKLLTTGNGRCNITNKYACDERYHSNNENFFSYAINTYGVKSTIEFFNSLGLPLVELDYGKMYPMSLQASSVIDVLRMTLEEREIPIHLNTKIKSIEHTKNFKLISSNNEEFVCKHLLVCTGGKSYPRTGSDGSAYSMCEKLGHSIIKPLPGIVQVKLNYTRLKALSGVRFQGRATMLDGTKVLRVEDGEILFTDYGISGPPILQLSRLASKASEQNKTLTLSVDLMPDYNKDELIDFLEVKFATFPTRSIHDNLIGVINKKIIPVILKECDIYDIHALTCDVDYNERNKLYSNLKGWNFIVSGTNSFDNAQVTLGGVNTKEVDNKTLESKLVPNLHFCGEILDVDGDCGGFNLQWCWSSAMAAVEGIMNNRINK